MNKKTKSIPPQSDSVNSEHQRAIVGNSLRKTLQELQDAEETGLKNLPDASLLFHPNEDTIEAIEESRRGEYAGTVDCSSFEAFKKSLGI